MKKIYTFALVALLSLIGLSANAYTLTVKADPTIVSKIDVAASSADLINEEGVISMEFSTDGKVNTFDASEWNYLYVRVTILPECVGVKYTAKGTKADGTGTANVMSLANKTSAYAQGFLNGWKNYDGGTLEVVTEAVAETAFTVVVNGDPSKFTFAVGQSTKQLVEGENPMKCTEKDYIMITPKGVAKLYQVLLGTQEYSLTDNMGIGMYQIQGSDITSGATLTINTDFPDVTHNVTLACNDWDFITSVKVDGNAIAPEDYQGKAFAVKEGHTLKVVGDKANYRVDKALANDTPLPAFGGQIEKVIESDYSLAFEVTKIIRDKKFTIEFASDVEGGYKTNLDVYTSLSAGSKTEVAYCNEELPITVFAQTTSSSAETRIIHVYRNGVDVAAGPSYKLTEENLSDGDVYRFQFEKQTFTVTATGTEFINATLYGNAITLEEGSNTLDINTEAEVARFEFSAKEGSRITTATVDGKDIEPDDEGVYSFTPFATNNVVIEAASSIVTVNINDVDGLLMGVIAIDGSGVFLENGENKIDLNSKEFNGGEYFAFAPNYERSYKISKLLFNGEDITDDPAYFIEGVYTFSPIKGGSVIDITTEIVERDDILTVFISGTENVTNPYLYNYFCGADLGGDLVDGYQFVTFNESYDCPLLFYYEKIKNGCNTFVYLDNEPVENDWGYNINATNSSVLKVYFQKEAPENVVDIIEVEGSTKSPIIRVDYTKIIEALPILRGTKTAFSHSELPGTYAVISAPEGDTYEEVYFDGVLQTPVDGAYPLTMDAAKEIMIYANGTGVETINADTSNSADIYNLQGIKVSRKDLPAGIYIQNGRKVTKF